MKTNTRTDIHMPQRFLLYMDILGVRNIIGKSSPETLAIKRIIDLFTSFFRAFEIDCEKNRDHHGEYYQLKNFSPEISNFSDHIVASYPKENYSPPFDTYPQSKAMCAVSLIRLVGQFHRLALEEGFLMRGAITQGGLWHTGNSILGPALIEVVDLEENTAIYPRVIIQDSLISTLKEYNSDLSSLYVEKDFDGIYFVNYLKHPDFVGMGSHLKEPLLAIKKQISNQLQSDLIANNMRLSSKWMWLGNKFDAALDYFHERIDTLKHIEKFNLNN